MPSTWIEFDRALPVLTFAYSFGPALATSLAVGIDGGVAVVSPPSRATDACFDALATYGPVSALVAPNAFHHLGLREWKRRFPDAQVYAPAQSIDRVARKSGLAGIRPVTDLARRTGPGVELTDMPHYRTGEALVRMSTSRGRVWFITDFVLNLETLEGPLAARVLLKATGSAPGLRINNIGPTFMVRDKSALKRWLAAQALRDPPDFLIPAHGAIARIERGSDVLARLFGPAT